MLKINIKHVGVCAGIMAGAIVGDVLIETVIKPIRKKLKDSKESKTMVNIDGEYVEATVEGA